VPVGRRFRDLVRADDGARAGAVLDDEGALQRLRQVLADDPSVDVRRPAGSERHDDLDVAARVILRGGRQHDPGGGRKD
jgi:hypothetical protein